MTQSDVHLSFVICHSGSNISSRDQWKCHHCCQEIKNVLLTWSVQCGWREMGRFKNVWGSEYTGAAGQEQEEGCWGSLPAADHKEDGSGEIPPPCSLGNWCPSGTYSPDVQLRGSKERLRLLRYLRKLRGGSVLMHQCDNVTNIKKKSAQENPNFFSIPWVSTEGQLCAHSLSSFTIGILSDALKKTKQI